MECREVVHYADSDWQHDKKEIVTYIIRDNIDISLNHLLPLFKEPFRNIPDPDIRETYANACGLRAPPSLLSSYR